MPRAVNVFQYRRLSNRILTLLQPDLSFKKHNRLLNRDDYVRLSSSKNSVAGRSFVVIWARNQGSEPRLGITASKRTGNAVTRNRLKRLIREFFRQNKLTVAGTDLNVIVRHKAALVSAAEAINELQYTFAAIGHK